MGKIFYVEEIVEQSILKAQKKWGWSNDNDEVFVKITSGEFTISDLEVQRTPKEHAKYVQGCVDWAISGGSLPSLDISTFTGTSKENMYLSSRMRLHKDGKLEQIWPRSLIHSPAQPTESRQPVQPAHKESLMPPTTNNPLGLAPEQFGVATTVMKELKLEEGGSYFAAVLTIFQMTAKAALASSVADAIVDISTSRLEKLMPFVGTIMLIPGVRELFRIIFPLAIGLAAHNRWLKMFPGMTSARQGQLAVWCLLAFHGTGVRVIAEVGNDIFKAIWEATRGIVENAPDVPDYARPSDSIG